MSLYLLDSNYPWLAKHSGFSLLPKALKLNGCPNTVITPRGGLLARCVGKSYSIFKRFPARNQAAAASECEFVVRMRLSQSTGHVLFLEDHLQYLSPPSKTASWTGTIHLPRRCWKLADLELLRRFSRVLVLCDYMRDQFDDVLDRSQIVVVPYGVDTSFFMPGSFDHEPKTQSLIYVGAWLRNTAMLARLIPEIGRKFPGVIFDLVVPSHARNDESMRKLSGNPAIRWHQKLSDEDLRALYQKATAMLIPMEDSGANTAIVEALACGLPIVTTDRGGIRSYGGGTVFPVVENNDDPSCLDLVSTYLTDGAFSARISHECRRFAVSTLDWEVAAINYIHAYRAFGMI